MGNSVETYLRRKGVACEVIRHAPTRTLQDAALAAGIPSGRLARAILLQDREGLLLALIPATHLLDFAAIKVHLGRALEPAPPRITTPFFQDCEPGAIPPVGEPYGIPVIVDERLGILEEVIVEPGLHTSLLRLRQAEFRRMLGEVRWGRWSRPAVILVAQGADEFVSAQGVTRTHRFRGLRPLREAREQVQRLRELPPMPQVAARILQLRNDPKTTIHDLAASVALDPSLAAQVVRYARSPFFGYRGKVESIEDSLRVLGFDMVATMALGLAVGKALRCPYEGPLGLEAFWRHSVYGAALSQGIAAMLPSHMRVKPDVAYLAGLLHDFGFLVIGHVFAPEFFLINRLVAANPEVPVVLMEKRVIGVDHARVGGWLMKAWNMPEPVIMAVREHHNETYAGPHNAYAQVVQVANHLLRMRGYGLGAGSDLPRSILTALGLDPARLDRLADRILEGREALDQIAQQLAA